MKVAAAIIKNKDEKFLFYLRDNKPSIPYPNCWSLLGGHVEGDETLEEALRREIKEEIEYELPDISFIGSFDDLVGNIVYIFKSEINKPLNEIVLNEGQRLNFFDFQELMDLEIPRALNSSARNPLTLVCG